VLPRKRLLLTLAVAALVALPAAVLAGLCLGNACERVDRAQGRVPFCSLPEELRSPIANGFRDARSPHILAVAGEDPIAAPPDAPWPSIDDASPESVPLVFAGTGVSGGAEVPSDTTLDAVAPTLAEIIGLRRPHPGVRSGEAVAGLASADRPRLVVLVTWKHVSSRELEEDPELWPVLRGLIEDGAATMDAEPGSLPADPAAILTTIGTGALPSGHGITGGLLRNDRGEVVRAWDRRSPFSVVAALGDDLDDTLGQAPRVGLVAGDITDRGLIGGNWYIDHDRDDVVIERSPESQAAAAEALLASGYGSDPTSDMLAVAMRGPVRRLDRALGRILVAARAASGGSLAMAVTSTGSGGARDSGGPSVLDVEADVELTVGADVIEASTPGGFFLDQDEMARSEVADDRVVAALRSVTTTDGSPLFADVFPAIAVTFARYC
jgi:hypothetical protein